MTAASPQRRRAASSVAGWFAGLGAALLAVQGLTGAYMPGEPAPRANLLVNPSMEIDQLNEGSSVSLTSAAAGATIVDGWKAAFTSAGHAPNAAVSCGRNAAAPTGFVNGLKCTVGTGASAVGSGDYLIVYQPIEASQLVSLGLGTSDAVTVCASWWQQASIASYIYGVSLTNFAGTRSYPQVFTSSGTANTWQQISACFPLDTTGTWVTGGSAGGAILAFAIAAGATYQGSVATWGGGQYYGTSALGNSALTTSGFTFLVAGVKLEASPVPTPFARRDVAAELALAQRYFGKSYDLGVAVGAVTDAGASRLTVIGAASNAQANQTVYYPTRMRCDPAITLYSPVTGASGKVADRSNSADVTGTTTGIGQTAFNWGAAPSTGAPISLYVHHTRDCRL